MATKLRGSRLEAEIDKYRGECDWFRLGELLQTIRSKKSGVEKLAHLIEGEMILEVFLEKRTDEMQSLIPKKEMKKLVSDRMQPRIQNKDFLRKAEGELRNAISDNSDEPAILMEAYLLLAKLYYFCSSFNESLSSFEKSKIKDATTQFTSLRSLKLAAEAYAINGLAIEQTLPKDRRENDSINKRVVNCFEKSAELALSYITELEKTVNASQTGYVQSQKATGFILEASLEKVSYLTLRRNNSDRRWDLEGLEWYRRIATRLGDKSVVMKLQQRICRELAEVLLRGSIEAGYDSKAITAKFEDLNFYTGSNKNFFAPSSRQEEVVLLLLISELLASKMLRMPGQEDDAIDRIRSFRNLKRVHNLLTIICANLRQYNLLSSIFDRAMMFSSKDRFLWFQIGLSLLCSGKITRGIKYIDHCTKIEAVDRNEITEHMMIAKLHIETLGDYDIAMEHATIALNLCQNNWQSSRCALLYAIAFSQKTSLVASFETKKVLLLESLKNFEKAIELDPHDELAHLFAAQEYAQCRDLEKAIDRCQNSLDINDEQPFAVMLMALLFTARGDYKGALTLVINALLDFPNHYGLLVLRLKLEAKFNRMEEVMSTSKHLLTFWRRLPITYNNVITEEEERFPGTSLVDKPTDTNLIQKPSNVQLNSKDGLAPMTPIFTAPLGLAAASKVSLNNSNLDITDNVSVMASTVANLSEFGGAASTVTDSMGLLSSRSGGIGSIAAAFRVQANIWVELAEFFIDADRASDVQACVEEACTYFPNSHETLYLKARLFIVRAKRLNNPPLAVRYRAEAKACLLAALSVLPSHLPSMQCLADLYHSDGNLILAEKMLRDVIAIDPLHYRQWHSLGCVLGEQKRFDEAQDCFVTAGTLEPSTPIIPFSVIPRLFKVSYF